MKNNQTVMTLIGDDAIFEGRLKFFGTTRIDGHFTGAILGIGRLIVGEGAVLDASIRVSSILVIGEIHGDITADQRLEIRKPGRVYGNIQSPTVIIDEGAVFEGNSRMKNIKKEKENILLKGFSDGQDHGSFHSKSGTFQDYAADPPSSEESDLLKGKG